MHYVYFIQRRRDKAVKIGVAANPETRVKQLQTGSSEPLSIVAKLPCAGRREAFAVERELHERYTNAKLVGEWFSPGAMRDVFKRLDVIAAVPDELGGVRRVVQIGEGAQRRISCLTAERNEARKQADFWRDRANTLEAEAADLRAQLSALASLLKR